MRPRAALVLPALALAFTPSGASAGTRAAVDRTGLDVLASIPVESEHGAGYSRTYFRHWIDADGDSCDTREEVLIDESLTPAQVGASGCRVVAGDWTSVYDGVTTTDPSTFDIDHVVALKEAWDSGAWQWSPLERENFANDLSDSRHLIAVSASSNRSKGDKDPAQWMPPRRDYACTYLADWVAVKSHWGLSMDSGEYGFVRKKFETDCASTTVRGWGESGSTGPLPVTSTSTAPRTPATTTPTGKGTVTSTTPVPSVVVRPGKVCGLPGAVATRAGRRYVCSVRDSRGRRHPDGKRRWRPA